MNIFNHPMRRWNDHADLSAPRPLLKFRDFADPSLPVEPPAGRVTETPLSRQLSSEEETFDAERWDGLS